MSRVQLTDTLQSVLVKMCDGNPGALSACCIILKDYSAVDPDSMLGGFGVILEFDDAGIYGSDIWLLWKGVCQQDIVKLAALLRARQLGELCGVTLPVIKDAMQHRGAGIDHDAILSAVRKELPAFATPKAEATR